MAASPISACILAYPETSASFVYGYHDVLASVGSVWSALFTSQEGTQLIDVRIVAATRKPFPVWGNIVVTPHATLDEVENTDFVCIPEFDIPLEDSPHGCRPSEVAWLREQYAKGATIGSACTGTMLLAETGLLDGQEATTHWAFKDKLARFYPRITVRPERILCLAGEDNRIVTAGGHASWHDLCLYLIARFCGVEHAIHVAKLFVMAEHDRGQLYYAAMPQRRQHGDPVIGDCQNWIANHYAEHEPIARMVARSGLAQRSFARRFRLATGYQPIDYVRSVRVEEAKQLLETTDDTVDEIALAVGYNDPASFRRLFKRKTGLTPSEYRRRLGRRRVWAAPSS